ncbi:MAG: hypothetical protein GVY25_09620 [Bacteroidetes bacterium]|nr:hypothetical protein [Bacteroidota bacterium]
MDTSSDVGVLDLSNLYQRLIDARRRFASPVTVAGESFRFALQIGKIGSIVLRVQPVYHLTDF